MVDSAVSFAIEQLGNFLMKEVNLRIGVKDDVMWLKTELGYLQVSVRAAEAKQEIAHIRLWINNVKDVANEAVIIVERFRANQEKRAVLKYGVLDCLWGCICLCMKEADLHDIGKDIISLKERVDDIKKRRDEYKINDIITTPIVQHRKRTLLRATSFENQVDMVGFEDDVKTLLAELVRDDLSLGMISIHGMGGLGKSTLASKLYHSSELSHFERRAWVCVSEDFNIIHVLKKIIRSFDGHIVDLLHVDEVDLMRQLRKLLLASDQYLVVIDDIWHIHVWEKIKKAFPDTKGSRVIITTRNKEVARGVDDRCFVHKLRFLTEDESWQLFCKRAKPTQNLEKLGEEMVGKCGGLPLAIMVLSGLLLHKKSYDEWSDVKDHLWRNLTQKTSEIQEILSLSYNDLSFQMRDCFLYLAMFPEDHNIMVDQLKLLWTAEEFISEADERDGSVMEDVAKDKLNELINRNMIQITGLKFNGEVSECRVHDLVRDLAIQKAKEHKLLGIFDSSKQHTSSNLLLQEQPRHAIYTGIGEYLKLLGPNVENLKLRSFSLINETHRLSKLQEIKLICTRFKYLKVLDLASAISSEIPNEIGNLVLLKFLGLMVSSEQALVIPQTIGKLKKLQTLSCPVSSHYQFPKEISELKELRHLIVGHNHPRPDRGSLKISSDQSKLQTLCTIGYKEWIQIDTLNLINLRTLSIAEDISKVKDTYTLDAIASLRSLQTLALRFIMTGLPPIKSLWACKRLKTVSLIGKIEDASELSFLPDSVMCLTLHLSKLTQDPMSTLGNLSNLTSLELASNVYIGEKMVCSHNTFPSLQYLRLECLWHLKELQVEDGAFPSLKGFEVDFITELKMIPPRLECVPSIPDTISHHGI